MRRFALILVLTFAAANAFAYTLSVTGDECVAGNFYFDDDDTAFVEKETITPSARSLRASVSEAPLSVVGGSGGGYVIEVCKAARRPADLARIRVTFENGELNATGPSNSRNKYWMVMYRIRTPRGADIDVSTENGPLSIRQVEGKVVASSHNGPLSIDDVHGNVDATTSNGPITVKGGSGTMNVRASNGPVSVHLEGNSWRDGTLDASTKNGPLSLVIPRGYRSGVVVEASGHGPVTCRAADCRLATRNWSDDDDWDEPRTIELGNGPEVVRLSTKNGPVSIKDAK